MAIGCGSSSIWQRHRQTRTSISTNPDVPDAGDLAPAIVLAASPSQVKVYRQGGGEALTLTGDAIKFAAKMLDDKAPSQTPAPRRRDPSPETGEEQWQGPIA